MKSSQNRTKFFLIEIDLEDEVLQVSAVSSAEGNRREGGSRVESNDARPAYAILLKNTRDGRN